MNNYPPQYPFYGYNAPYYPSQMNMSMNPMQYQNPMMPMSPIKKSLIPFNMQTTLRTAQKAITTFNQVIPVIYQVRPIVSNAKTAFRVIKAVKQMDLDPSFDQEIDDALKNVTDEDTQFENML
ncbi:MAG: hypothetical protein ACLRVU_03090 [Beduini sp.]|uniref:hypothetical protein n=1 Tax=Beduini sp. TaxID=1922300 RepID=UPI0039A011B4